MDEILRRDNKLREQLEKKSQAMRSESVLNSSSLPHKSTASRSGSVLSDSAPIAAWLHSSGASLTESHKQSKESAACRQQPRETSPDCVSLKVLIQVYVNKNVKKHKRKCICLYLVLYDSVFLNLLKKYGFDNKIRKRNQCTREC